MIQPRPAIKRLADMLAAASLACAFLVIALSAFDAYSLAKWYLFRPSHGIAIAGMALWLFSGRWLPGLRRHWRLFALVFLLLGLGGASTWIRAAEHNSEQLFTFFTRMYVKERVLPFFCLCWTADLFASLPGNKARRVFSLALICLFIPNAVHAALEMLANAGADSVKSFLLEINRHFRLEGVSHGWHPPPYYADRVRGLYAEPSFMAMGLLPLLGLFAHGALRDRRALAALLFLSTVYCASVSYSGYIAMAVFFGLLGAWRLRLMPAGRRNACLGAALALAGILALTAWHSPRFAEFAHNAQNLLQNTERISAYLRDAHDGGHPEPPVPHYRRGVGGSASARLLSLRLDLDMGLRFPLLGVGFRQRGFYWQPLERIKVKRQEWFIWVRYAAADPFRTVPTMSEYTGTLAEAGAPGLLAELALLAFIAVRAFRRFFATRDAYVGCMACAYAALLAGLNFILTIIVVFPFLAGFLYAISTPEQEK